MRAQLKCIFSSVSRVLIFTHGRHRYTLNAPARKLLQPADSKNGLVAKVRGKGIILIMLVLSVRIIGLVIHRIHSIID